MFTYYINYTIEREEEISENALEIARDTGGQAISDSIEGSGGGIPQVGGVIQSGRDSNGAEPNPIEASRE